MSSVRGTRLRLLTAAAAVATAALSLTLTACGDESGDDGGKSSAGGSLTASSGSGNGETGDSGTGDPGGSGKRAVACEGSGTRTVAAPVNEPVNHLLLTVTNTGSAPCDLYGYPTAGFGEAQSVPPVIKDSEPEAVVTLAPGESGYAGVTLSATDGTGKNGRTETSLTVAFQDRTGKYTPSAAHPPLPAKGVHVDDSLSVTYWQRSMDDALTW
ncbi:MAG: DUF4232 domain-containing protein [Streptomyces sp.]|nr:DUF4232 domain-containing protein [Streptomyces sp.]